MNKILFGLAAVIAASLATLSGNAELRTADAAQADANPRWIVATQPGCNNTCSASGLVAVSSGVHSSGNTFYVCAGNANGEGFRPGYNMRPNLANKCTVGWGGKELQVPTYRCLCR